MLESLLVSNLFHAAEKAVVEKLKSLVLEFLIVKVVETSTSVTSHFNRDQREQLGSLIKAIVYISFDSLFDSDKRKELGSDVKSAVNAMNASLALSVYKASKEETDPVVKAFLGFILSCLDGDATIERTETNG